MILDKLELATLQKINVLKQQQVPEKDPEKMIHEPHNRPLDKTRQLSNFNRNTPFQG